MTEILNSIKAILYDRAVSPLFGTFAAAWTFWNYKFFLVLFSSMEIEGKLAYIQYVLYDSDTFTKVPFFDLAVSNVGLTYPIYTTIAAILIYPLFSLPVYAHGRYFASLMRQIKDRFEGEELLSVSKSREIRRLVAEQAQQFDTSLEKQNEEISFLKNLNGELLSEINDLKNRPSESLPLDKKANITNALDSVLKGHEDNPFESRRKVGLQLTETQEALLRVFCDHDRVKSDAMLGFHTGGKLKAEYDLERLLEEQLVSTSGPYSDGGKPFTTYQLTKKGRAYIVENELDK